MEFKILRAPTPCFHLLAGPTPNSSYSIRSPKRTDLGFGWHLSSKKMIHSIESTKSRASNARGMVAMEQRYDVTTETLSLKVMLEMKGGDLETRIKEVDAIVSEIVGKEGLKAQLRKWIKGLLLEERRKELNLNVGNRKVLHMAFLGNPGTGKTMVAWTLGKILNKLGLIKGVVQVQATELIDEYWGYMTREKIDNARGGILVVDNAHRLMPSDNNGDKDCRLALERIITAMNDKDVVVIFAGYMEKMQHLISENTRSLIKFFYFDDYSPTDVATILRMNVEKQDKDSLTYGFILHPDCTVEAISGLIEKHVTEEQLKMLNGGLVYPWLVNALENMNIRVDVGSSDDSALLTIRMEDLEEGIKSVMA